MQTCSKCRVVLTAENANSHKTGQKAGHFQNYCRPCASVKHKEFHTLNREDQKAKSRARYALHREEEKAKARAYARAHKEERNAYNRAYWGRNKEELKARSRSYKALHREGINATTRKWKKKNWTSQLKYQVKYQRNRRRNDPAFRIRGALGSRLRIGIIWAGGTKSHRTHEYIGCSFKELRLHLEKKFRPGMTWENYGPVWHVDHIRPCASFDLTDMEQQRACFHYSNLQPLFKEENIKKGAKWSGNLVD